MTARTGASQKHHDDKAKQPIDLKSEDASENDRLHAATEIQSSVKPEDYPEEKRDLQVDAATDGKGAPPSPVRRKTPPG